MAQPAFVYETIILNKDDYDFFKGLPTREKLLFLYDLCLEVENLEDVEEDYVIDSNSTELLDKKLLTFLDQACSDPNYVHILLLPDVLILAGNTEFAIASTKTYLYSDGYIFVTSTRQGLLLDNEINEFKKRFKYVEVLDLLSIIHPGSLN
jgi:hypothetical protein